MTTHTDTDTVTTAQCVRTARRTRGLAVVAATAATLTVWTVAVPVAGVNLKADTGSGPATVTALAVVLTTVLAGLAAWGVLALLERFTRRAVMIWPGVATAVLAVSLLGPVGSGVGAGATAALVSMHLIAAAVLVPTMARSAARRGC